MERFFLEKTGSWSIIQDMLNMAERADELTVCSFAMAEGVMRRLIKERRRISKITVILDFTVATRNRTSMLFIAKNVDELWLCNSHAKLILVENEKFRAVCALSANSTMNYRYECGIITDNKDIVNEAKKSLEIMKKDGKRIIFN
jgi:hypothetical protein